MDEVIASEATALSLLAASEYVDEELGKLAWYLQSSPLYVCTGLGKSGHVARNVAGTLNCLGLPAVYVHPVEALHGDLGLITGNEAVVAFSASGATGEVVSFVHACQERGCRTGAVLGYAGAALSVVAGRYVATGFGSDDEAFGRIPSVSLVTQLAVGHALAVRLALLRDPGATGLQDDGNHPGGDIGSRITQ